MVCEREEFGHLLQHLGDRLVKSKKKWIVLDNKACFFLCFSDVGLSAADGLIGYHFSVHDFSHQNTFVFPSSFPKFYCITLIEIK